MTDAADRLSLADLTVTDFLALLASPSPAPGGGAAAALAGALGAALVEMTANLTVGRPRFAAVEDDARRIAARASELRLRLAEDVAADAEAYARVSAAYKLPRATDGERSGREAAIQSALETAATVPLRVAGTCADLLDLCLEAAPILNPNVISDVVVGAQLAHAALEAAAVNVEVNLRTMTREAAVAPLRQALARAQDGASAKLSRVLAVGRPRMPGGSLAAS